MEPQSEMNYIERPMPDNYYIERLRPALVKMFEVCQEEGLSMRDLELTAIAFSELVKYQVSAVKKSTTFHIMNVFHD